MNDKIKWNINNKSISDPIKTYDSLKIWILPCVQLQYKLSTSN